MTEPVTYRIRIQAALGREWTSWFDGLELIEMPDGSTLLVGPIADQAALHGVLARVRDLALTLVSVEAVGLDVQSADERARDQSQED